MYVSCSFLFYCTDTVKTAGFTYPITRADYYYRAREPPIQSPLASTDHSFVHFTAATCAFATVPSTSREASAKAITILRHLTLIITTGGDHSTPGSALVTAPVVPVSNLVSAPVTAPGTALVSATLV